MNKHTPAPWEISHEDEDIIIESNIREVDICQIVGGRYFEEDEANAKLIAAAPELLEAAIKLQEWNQKYPPNKVYDYGRAKAIETELTEIVNMQLEAIKKATE